MIKKKLFIMTHIGSDWEKLAEFLEKDKKFHVFNTGKSYRHPDDVCYLTSQIHRKDNASAVWVDVILHNKDFTMKRLCPFYNFIFWSKTFEECNLSIHQFRDAQSYWEYRMEGLKQYYKRRPNSLWNPDLQDESILSSYLG